MKPCNTKKYLDLFPFLLIIAFFLLLILTGCGSKEFIKEQEITVIPAPIIAELPTADYGSYIQGLQLRDTDTVIDVRYYPIEKRIYVMAKPDTIRVIYPDTVKQTITKIQEVSWWEKLGYMFFGCILVIVFIIIIKAKLF